MCHRWAALLAWVAVVTMSWGRVSATSNIMQHLSTKAPYAHRLPIPGAPSIHAAPDPAGYKPVYMYLVARHGTRWPTAGRSRQMAKLVHLLRDATAPEHQWAVNWTCPVHDIPYVAGELHDTGVEEMFSLGERLRDRFPQISQQRYYPKRFPLVSTQVARAAQSANAFALGFFSPSQSNTHHMGSGGTVHAPHEHAVPAQQQEQEQQQQQQPPWQVHDDRGSTDTSSSSSREEGSQAGSSTGGKRMQHSSDEAAPHERKRVRVQQSEGSNSFSLGQSQQASATAATTTSNRQWDVPAAAPGLYGGHGKRARRAVRAVALTMARKKHDPLLRFFEAREDYKQHERQVERWLAPWLMSHWASLAPTLEQRLGLPAGRLTANEVDALWQLCGFETGVLEIQDQACKLFTEQDAQLMEWLEDVRLYEVQSYGSAINYQIAWPLLADLGGSLVKAASEAARHPGHLVQEEQQGVVVDLEDDEALLQQPVSAGAASGSSTSSSSSGSTGDLHSRKHTGPLQLAKLHFAHCETLTPLSALMGLFRPSGAEAAAEPSAGLDLEAELVAAEAQHASRASPTSSRSSRSRSGAESTPRGLASVEGAGAAAGGDTAPSPVSIDSTDDVLYAMLEEGSVHDMTAQQAAQFRSQVAPEPHTGGAHSSSRNAGAGVGHNANAGDANTSDIADTGSSSSSRFLYRGKRWIDDPLPPPVGWTPLSTDDSKQDNHPSASGNSDRYDTASSSARSDAAPAIVGHQAGEEEEETEELVVAQRRRLHSGSTPAADGAEPGHRLADAAAGEVLPNAGDGRGDDRVFRGGRVSPLGANLLVILYQQQQQQQQQRPLGGGVEGQTAVMPTMTSTSDGGGSSGSSSSSRDTRPADGHRHAGTWKLPGAEGSHPLPDAAQLEQFRVRVVWNEQVVVVPGCSGPDVPLAEFLECMAAVQEEAEERN